MASEVLVSLEGDGLEGWGLGGEHWGLITEHRLGDVWLVFNGLELSGLLLDSSVGSAVDSGVAGDLWNWDVAASVGDGWQDWICWICSSSRSKYSGGGRL